MNKTFTTTCTDPNIEVSYNETIEINKECVIINTNEYNPTVSNQQMDVEIK